jgi:ATP-dependent DNA helicase RecG
VTRLREGEQGRPPADAGPRGSIVEAEITDGRGYAQADVLQPAVARAGARGRPAGLFAGKVTVFNGKRQLNSPDFRILDADDSQGDIEEFRRRPHPGIPGDRGDADLDDRPAACASRSTSWTPPPDPLPADLRTRHRLVGSTSPCATSIARSDRAALELARTRLKWDEALPVQALLAQRRLARRAGPARPARRPRTASLAAFDRRLPFALTDGQRSRRATAGRELGPEHPMHRLLQGEVGSARPSARCGRCCRWSTPAARPRCSRPTEVLAAQHDRSLARCSARWPRRRAGRGRARDPGRAADRLAAAAARRGRWPRPPPGGRDRRRHARAALEGVEFADLGLVVVDEQHRFGVEQRDALRAKARQPPHVLVMTATPIPRTVAMTVYGDLEVVAAARAAGGRSPIASTVVPAAEKPAWLDRAGSGSARRSRRAPGVRGLPADRRTGARTRPRNRPTRTVSRRPPLAVLDVAPAAEGPLHELRVGVLHGRLPADEKDAVMRGFAAGDVDVLVATTVVEVGVDVPNATVMVDPGRRPVRRLPAAPAARPGRPRLGAGLCLLVTESPPGRRPGSGWTRWRPLWTDSGLARGSTWSNAGTGQVLGEGSSPVGLTFRGLLSLVSDPRLITAARGPRRPRSSTGKARPAISPTIPASPPPSPPCRTPKRLRSSWRKT